MIHECSGQTKVQIEVLAGYSCSLRMPDSKSGKSQLRVTRKQFSRGPAHGDTNLRCVPAMSSALIGKPPRKRYLERDICAEQTRVLCRRTCGQSARSSAMTRRLDEAPTERRRNDNQKLQNREVVLQAMANEAIIALRRSHPTIITAHIPKPVSPSRFLKRVGISDTGVSEQGVQLTDRLAGVRMRIGLKHLSSSSQPTNAASSEEKHFRTSEFGLPEMSQVGEEEDDESPSTCSKAKCCTPRKLFASTERLTMEEATCVTPSRVEAACNLLALTK
jgi:hypothetical protein